MRPASKVISVIHAVLLGCVKSIELTASLQHSFLFGVALPVGLWLICLCQCPSVADLFVSLLLNHPCKF